MEKKAIVKDGKGTCRWGFSRSLLVEVVTQQTRKTTHIHFWDIEISVFMALLVDINDHYFYHNSSMNIYVNHFIEYLL